MTKSKFLRQRLEQLKKQLQEIERLENEKLGSIIRKLYFAGKHAEIQKAIEAFFEEKESSFNDKKEPKVASSFSFASRDTNEDTDN